MGSKNATTTRFTRWRVGVFCILFFIFFLNVTDAAEYPMKPIQLITAFPPGGGGDTVARIVVNKLSSVLGQPVVVVNKAGGGGVIGTYAAKAAAPDGYTIFIAAPPMLRHPLTTKGVTYDIVKDFVPVNLPVSVNMVTVVKNDAPWRSMRELVDDAKKNPGKLSFSSPGYGGTAHFVMEMLKLETKTDITHVPMDGTAPQVAGVLGGHISMTTAELGLVNKLIEAKSLRGLAVWAKKRDKVLPDIPTTTEAGFPNLLDSSWQAFFVPVKTPDPIVKKLERAFNEAMKDKETIATFEKAGWVIENLNSRETADFISNCQKKYTDVARAINMVPK